jgi:hypothetical protein
MLGGQSRWEGALAGGCQSRIEQQGDKDGGGQGESSFHRQALLADGITGEYTGAEGSSQAGTHNVRPDWTDKPAPGRGG